MRLLAYLLIVAQILILFKSAAHCSLLEDEASFEEDGTNTAPLVAAYRDDQTLEAEIASVGDSIEPRIDGGTVEARGYNDPTTFGKAGEVIRKVALESRRRKRRRRRRAQPRVAERSILYNKQPSEEYGARLLMETDGTHHHSSRGRERAVDDGDDGDGSDDKVLSTSLKENIRSWRHNEKTNPIIEQLADNERSKFRRRANGKDYKLFEHHHHEKAIDENDISSSSNHQHHHSPLANSNSHHPQNKNNNNNNNNHHHHRRRLRDHSLTMHEKVFPAPAEEHKQSKSVVHKISSNVRRNSWWCHRDCNSTNNNSQQQDQIDLEDEGEGEGRKLMPYASSSFDGPICASNGHFYASLCELKRFSCRNQLHLLQMSNLYCQNGSSIESSHLLESNYNTKGGEQVRIVELRQRCTRFELEEMKLIMLKEFDGNLSSMFNYFDSNGDKLIEAHELWPRRDMESNKFLYAQIWDEHSNWCKSHQEQQSIDLDEEKKESSTRKCWFFLDFAFEPKYANNSCSLSHLMLFDLKHPNNHFDYEQFREAFLATRLEALAENQIGQNSDTKGDKNYPKPQPLKRVTNLSLNLGESLVLNCLGKNNISSKHESQLDQLEDQLIEEDAIENVHEDNLMGPAKCLWSRYNLNLASIRDSHIFIQERTFRKDNENLLHDLELHIRDAQLYLSGAFKCTCHMRKLSLNYEHIYNIQVLGKPRVVVQPHYQKTISASRVSFECQYDYIDTSLVQVSSADMNFLASTGRELEQTFGNQQLNREGLKNNGLELKGGGHFGLRVEWWKGNESLSSRESLTGRQVRQSKDNDLQMNNIINLNNGGEILKNSTSTRVEEDLDSSTSLSDSFYSSDNDDDDLPTVTTPPRKEAPSPSLHSASTVTMASSKLTLEGVQANDSGQYMCRVEDPLSNRQRPLATGATSFSKSTSGFDYGRLVVVETGGESGELNEKQESEQSSFLWMFHENGISVYKLQNEDGQEMELAREINGHTLVSSEVDGNWNQLTLCGGLNPEQVVICEWSDNALYIDVNSGKSSKTTMKYVYVGQPNLNRVIVMDASKFEIVAIINTEPQPRKLHLYKPNKMHLSKWVRRRLSPIANARWLAAIGTHAHALKATPESQLYSIRSEGNSKLRENTSDHRQEWQQLKRRKRRERRFAQTRADEANQLPSSLIQHDIWLLCYGQPLVVDPAVDEGAAEQHLEDLSVGGSYSQFVNNSDSMSNIHPFTPRLSGASGPFAWSIWPNRESKLRNRKSVHIIQSTFFPQFLPLRSSDMHHHDEEEEEMSTLQERRNLNRTVVYNFKRSAVITTHHVFAGIPHSRFNQQNVPQTTRFGNSRRFPASVLGNRNHHQFDLIQDLHVPSKPYSMRLSDSYKIHYSYVTHYDEQRLFRVNMDEYRYDQEIDLQNCDPINLLTTAQGILVVQCRAPITHNLIGQLVLDELTSSRIEFNANIRAQESYMSPDNRYLISIYNNLTAANDLKKSQQQHENSNEEKQSIIYVQSISVSGLKLQYEIKTSSLDISQCSFVWKDGYYAAIFVSTNKRDEQSEILSLRLADGRLELMARVSGSVSSSHSSRRKDQLLVSPELKLAVISTTMGTYVIDLEENRVSQSLRHHQSPPTLLWV